MFQLQANIYKLYSHYYLSFYYISAVNVVKSYILSAQLSFKGVFIHKNGKFQGKYKKKWFIENIVLR